MFCVKIKKLLEDASIPAAYYEGDAGLDLSSIESLVIHPGKRALVHTGIAIELPKGTEGQIRPRSGYALKNGVTVLNTPGTIDEGYRDELGVILINLGDEDFFVEKGMRIAQLVIKPVVQISFQLVDELDPSERGTAGFGSSSSSIKR